MILSASFLSGDFSLQKTPKSDEESEPNLTLKKLAEDCQRIISVKKDSRDIEESGVAHARKLHKKLLITPRKKQQGEDAIPSQTGKTS